MKRCPGSLFFTQPKPEIVSCPDCGADVELWSDEPSSQCPACGRMVIRKVGPSCVDWCRFAKECLGDEKFKRYGEMKATMRKNTLMQAVADLLEGDKYGQAEMKKVVAYAEAILAGEASADPNVVIAAAALSPMVQRLPGGRAALASTPAGASPGTLQVRKLLAGIDYPQSFAESVLQTLRGGPGPDGEETANCKILHDAEQLAKAEHRQRRTGPAAPGEEFLATLRTPTARRVAAELGSFMAGD